MPELGFSKVTVVSRSRRARPSPGERFGRLIVVGVGEESWCASAG